jgi:hypothetical protein
MKQISSYLPVLKLSLELPPVNMPPVEAHVPVHSYFLVGPLKS